MNTTDCKTLPINANENLLFPAIIQDNTTKQVLMLGYMNKDAYQQTLTSKRITFFSRSKQRLWTKGESSGNYLKLISYEWDCDKDSLLIKVNPTGSCCHLKTTSCWGNDTENEVPFIDQLETLISKRISKTTDSESSYISTLYEKGIAKIAQKMGEEAIEVVIESMRNKPTLFKEECADLMFHFLILLQAKNFRFNDIIKLLKKRANLSLTE